MLLLASLTFADSFDTGTCLDTGGSLYHEDGFCYKDELENPSGMCPTWNDAASRPNDGIKDCFQCDEPELAGKLLLLESEWYSWCIYSADGTLVQTGGGWHLGPEACCDGNLGGYTWRSGDPNLKCSPSDVCLEELDSQPSDTSAELDSEEMEASGCQNNSCAGGSGLALLFVGLVGLFRRPSGNKV
jgi:hypothetical protein